MGAGGSGEGGGSGGGGSDGIADSSAVSPKASLAFAGLVARAFQPLLPYFMVYATYCGNYTEAPANLADARRAKSTIDVVVVSGGARAGVQLEQLLFRPVQRVSSCAGP